MPNGIYSAAAGMAAQQTRMDAIANDLANVNTTGYKSERVGFRDLVYGAEQNVAVGTGAAAIDAGRSFRQGTLMDSGNPLSVGISGAGFFQLRRADGTTALTRDGNFHLDANGSLVTSSGEQLVPPLRVPKGTQPDALSIAQDGTVTVTGAKTPLGKIQVVDVPAPDGLQSVGNSMFVPSTASGAPSPVPVTGAVLQQGQLEASSVDVATAMTDLLDAQRSFQLQSRVINMQDQLLQIANQLRS